MIELRSEILVLKVNCYFASEINRPVPEKKDGRVIDLFGTNMPMATHTVNELQSFLISAACITFTGSPRTSHNHFYNILGHFQML